MRTLYTDGSASPNPGPGGYAVIENGVPVALGGDKKTSNIKMEGSALIAAMLLLDGEAGEVVTDSEFWVNVLTKWAPTWRRNNWVKRNGEIKNLDLVKKAYELYNQGNVKLKWTRGHVGTEMNELADVWANKAREGERL